MTTVAHTTSQSGGSMPWKCMRVGGYHHIITVSSNRFWCYGYSHMDLIVFCLFLFIAGVFKQLLFFNQWIIDLIKNTRIKKITY